MKFLSQYKGLRRETYILFIGRIVTSLGAMIWPVMTLLLNQKLGMNATSVAAVMMITGLIQIPIGLWGGKLADQYNKKNIIVICDSVSIVFYIICGLMPLTYLSLIMILIAASCQSMENPAYEALIADINPTRDRERAYSLLYLGANIGMVASPTIAGLLFANYLWLSFMISGVAIAFSTLLIFLFVRNITPEKEEGAASVYQTAREDASVFVILKENRVVVLYLLLMALFWGAYNQYGYLMPLDLARVHGDLGALIYGSVSSLNCIVVVIFTPILTHLFRKLCYTKKSLLGIVLVAGGYVIFLTGLGFLPAYYMAITMFTWGEIMTSISSGPYAAERIPASHRGRINSIMTVATTIIVNGGMLMSGILFDNFGSTTAWCFVLGILVVSIIGNMILIIWDRKAYPKLYE